jgi:hypothetical protein
MKFPVGETAPANKSSRCAHASEAAHMNAAELAPNRSGAGMTTARGAASAHKR